MTPFIKFDVKPLFSFGILGSLFYKVKRHTSTGLRRSRYALKVINKNYHFKMPFPMK